MGGDPDKDLARQLRALPAVDRVAGVLASTSTKQASAAARRAIDAARVAIRSGKPAPSFEAIVETARGLVGAERTRLLQPVINATGVLLHTNLGRAPLGAEQLDAVRRVAGGYSNLEYDISSGTRGDRYSHARGLLTSLTNAESALVVNNNAAAVLLVLAALCRDREVVVSRGELIEIGGEFRVPDVMAASGALLVEVGTTNRTHLSDYERALGADTAAVMKVHPSNYQVVGFTASVPARDLARVAHDRDVLFIHDLGSGYVGRAAGSDIAQNDPPVDVALEDGADLVTFSGDKLLGGPQAGIIVGRADLIERLSRHALLRALRVDKMTLAALEATLSAYLAGRPESLPVWQAAAVGLDELEGRTQAIAARMNESRAKVEAVPSTAVAGGGSLPGTEISSWAISVVHEAKSPDEVARSMRFADPPVIGRIEDDRVLLDLRAVPREQDAALMQVLQIAIDE